LHFAAFLLALAAAGNTHVNTTRQRHPCIETLLIAAAPPDRVVHWAGALEPVTVENFSTHAWAPVRLYTSDGAVDTRARDTFERIAASPTEPHPLAVRLEQLIVKAAYHFKGARVLVVSGWRRSAGRHSAGDAIDFKLDGVRPAQLAAYLRELPRAGVGVYTHPHTQFVHLDVREPSYHWIDASPPGIKWHEARLRDPSMARRDASWTPDMDLPI